MRTPAWLQRYQRPMPAAIGRPIGTPSRYTGAGRDGVIQKNMPVERDLYENHEGEYVVNAEDTARNGGERGIEKKLNIRPRTPIRFACGGKVKKFMSGGKVHKYQTGGIVGDPYEDRVATKTPEAIARDLAQEEKRQTAITGPIVGEPYGANRQETYGLGVGGISRGDPYADRTIQRTPEAIQRAETQEAKRQALISGPISGEPYGADRGKAVVGGTDVTALVKAKEDAQEVARQRALEGRPTTTTAATPSAEPEAGTAEAAERDYYSGKAGDFVSMMEDIATGQSPIFKRMSDIAFGNLNPQLQVGLTQTAMQIAQNPNMTEGMKQTMMAQAIRDVGIQQSGLASDLAQKAMELATNAVQQGFTMSANQQSFFETARSNANNEAWQDFEYTAQYGSDQDVVDAYKAATGKDLDPAAVEEIRGYSRQKRQNDLTMDALSIQATKTQLGVTQFGAVKTMIDGGATLEEVLSTYPEFGQDESGNDLSADEIQERYNSIYNAGPLGDRKYNRDMGLVSTLLDAGGADNIAQAAQILNSNFPGLDIDFSGLLSDENIANFNEAMSTVSAIIATPGANWDTAQLALGAEGIAALGGEDAAKKLFGEMQYKTSPIGRLLETYDDAFIASAYPDADPNAVRRVIAKASLLGGYVVNEKTGQLELADPTMLTQMLQDEGIIEKPTVAGTVTLGSVKDIDMSNMPEYWTQTSDQLNAYLTANAGSTAAEQISSGKQTPEKALIEYKDDPNYQNMVVAGYALQVNSKSQPLFDAAKRFFDKYKNSIIPAGEEVTKTVDYGSGITVKAYSKKDAKKTPETRYVLYKNGTEVGTYAEGEISSQVFNQMYLTEEGLQGTTLTVENVKERIANGDPAIVAAINTLKQKAASGNATAQKILTTFEIAWE